MIDVCTSHTSTRCIALFMQLQTQRARHLEHRLLHVGACTTAPLHAEPCIGARRLVHLPSLAAACTGAYNQGGLNEGAPWGSAIYRRNQSLRARRAANLQRRLLYQAPLELREHRRLICPVRPHISVFICSPVPSASPHTYVLYTAVDGRSKCPPAHVYGASYLIFVSQHTRPPIHPPTHPPTDVRLLLES